ncbi:MAG: serine hydrolase domain-containing protein [Candidatus Cybelea sp.]
MGAWGRYNQTLRRCVAFAISASLLVGIMGCGNGERHPSTVAGRREQVIDGFIRRTMSRLGLPSVSIAVVSEGHIEDEREIDRTPVGVQESGGGKRYEIGSVTKQFTAAAILLLQQDGKLTLDEPVSRFFPDLTEAGRVTLRELLSHTAGYPDYYATLSSRAIFRDTTLDRILSQYAKVPLDFRPGTRWAYSNTGYTILTRIIEKASGESYSGFLSSRIFRPLRMSSAIYEGRPDFGRQTVVGYERVLLGPLQRAEPEGRNWLNGAAGLAMTAHDLAIWNISLLRGDLLSAASKKAMFAIQRASGRPTGYGLGFYVTHLGNETFISHEGSVKGFTSESALIPQNNFAVVVLCNQGDTIAPLFLAEGIAGAYNLFPLSPRAPAGARPIEVVGSTFNDPAALRDAREMLSQLRAGALNPTFLTVDEAAVATPQRLSRVAAALHALGAAKAFRGATQSQRADLTLTSVTMLFKFNLAIGLSFAKTRDGKLADLSVNPR